MATGLRRIALILVSIALIVPLFVTTIPPLLDYPSTLARMAAIAAGSQDADVARLYTMHWRIAPDLGMDPLVPLLAPIMPLTLVAKLFLALALILPFLGTVALHDAIFEKRSWWPLASAIVVYNAALLAGFLDFMIALGLALLGTACWVRLAKRPRRQLAAGAAIAAAILLVHVFSAAFYLVMIGSFELRAFRNASSASQLRHRVAKLLIAVLPTALIYLRALTDGKIASPLRIAKGLWWTLAKADLMHKALGAAASFFTYDLGSDLLILIAVAAAIAALALARKLSFAWPIAIGLGLLLTFLLVTGFASSWTDIRLPVLAGFLLFAGITPRRLGRRETAVLGLAFAALIVARLGVITLAWQGQNADLADIATVLTPVKVQDRVLVMAAPQAATQPARLRSLEPLTAQLN